MNFLGIVTGKAVLSYGLKWHFVSSCTAIMYGIFKAHNDLLKPCAASRSALLLILFINCVFFKRLGNIARERLGWSSG